MINITVESEISLFQNVIEVWDGIGEEAKVTITLEDLFEGYANNLIGGFGFEEAKGYILNTLDALEKGKRELLYALEYMRERNL